MDSSILAKIRDHALARSGSLPFKAASKSAIDKAERALGFAIPAFLKECYRSIGNGGFGPGHGIIGLSGGYKSDLGDLVGTYEQLKGDHELEKMTWPEALLPFCEWGCNIFSCVDCNGPENRCFLVEEGEISPQSYHLNEFFEMWMKGVDILALGGAGIETKEATNPFTGGKIIIRRSRRKKS